MAYIARNDIYTKYGNFTSGDELDVETLEKFGVDEVVRLVELGALQVIGEDKKIFDEEKIQKDENSGDEELDGMTVKELQDYAFELGIEIPKQIKKADLIALIVEKEAENKANEDEGQE